jgi:hypothetical protein
LQVGKEEAMKWICVMAGVLSTVAYAIPAQAAAIEDCPVPPGTIKVELPLGLPPALGKAMGNNIALPGEPFDATDVVVKGHKSSRYIFVWNIGKRWIVATEQGGIALRAMVFVYELRKEGTTAALIEKRITFPQSVCGDATGLAGR